MTDKELALEICGEIRSGHKKICLPYRLEPGDPGLTDSKVDGIPYFPKEEPWPKDVNGAPLLFLSQIDCTQLAALPDFPHTGLLQFFVGSDDVWGMDFDDMTNTGGFRVFYWETVDPSVTKADVAAKQPPVPEEYGSPVCKPCCIVFQQPWEQAVPDGDFLFETLFVEKWNRRCPEKPLKTLWDFYNLFPKEERDYSIFEENPDGEDETGVPNHRMDGFPFFTQSDPRTETLEYESFDTLLFQLDSDSRDRKDLVLWGDCGVGNFFINREALKRRDFSKVLYNWDCC